MHREVKKLTQHQTANVQAPIYALGWLTGAGPVCISPHNGEGGCYFSLSYVWVICDTERRSDISEHKWGSLE